MIREVGAGQELFQLLFEPLLGLVPLAQGTMSIATGLRQGVIRAAGVATVYRMSQLSGAAACKLVHHPELLVAHAGRVLGTVGRAILAKDLAEGGPGRGLVRLGRWWAE